MHVARSFIRSLYDVVKVHALHATYELTMLVEQIAYRPQHPEVAMFDPCSLDRKLEKGSNMLSSCD